jgi:hypothetical protein
MRIPFFGLAVLLVLSLAGLCVALLHRFGVYPQSGAAQP